MRQFRPALQAWEALGAVSQHFASEELMDASPGRVCCPRLLAARGDVARDSLLRGSTRRLPGDVRRVQLDPAPPPSPE